MSPKLGREVASLLHADAADANVSEGEIVERAAARSSRG
jgi:hypothetical protein